MKKHSFEQNYLTHFREISLATLGEEGLEEVNDAFDSYGAMRAFSRTRSRPGVGAESDEFARQQVKKLRAQRRAADKRAMQGESESAKTSAC